MIILIYQGTTFILIGFLSLNTKKMFGFKRDQMTCTDHISAGDIGIAYNWHTKVVLLTLDTSDTIRLLANVIPLT